MQGTYRIRGDPTDWLESFVAAPGPMGWRYFARVSAIGEETESFTVDFVVDADWRLVRYRERHADGSEVLVAPAANGLEVLTVTGGGERSVEVPNAETVWTSSPCSLLVADRRARTSGRDQVMTARIGSGDPEPAAVSFREEELKRQRRERESRVRIVEVDVGGEVVRTVMGEEFPMSAAGWFDLIS